MKAFCYWCKQHRDGTRRILNADPLRWGHVCYRCSPDHEISLTRVGSVDTVRITATRQTENKQP